MPALLLGLTVVGGATLVTYLAMREWRASIPAQQKPVKGTPHYPYPECQACMDWLQENANDPKSIEIIRWNRLTSTPKDPWPNPKTIRIDVGFRARNQYGAIGVFNYSFFFIDGKIRSVDPFP